MVSLLSTTYFGPVQWYSKLYRSERVMLERYDTYRKQTFRNRCIIATTNGLQALTIPVVRPDEGLHATLVKDLRISDHANWRHQHWHALMSAYNESPFFEYYADDFRPFYEKRWDFLYDFNMETMEKVCELIDIHPTMVPTDNFTPMARQEEIICTDGNEADLHDFRDAIDPKHPAPDPDFTPRPYYQVYSRKHGFQSNLSILDLLFNMGPESIFYL